MDDLRACFIGDSLTYGQGDESGLGWPGRVAQDARRSGHRLTAYNLGIRGETGPQIAARATIEAAARLGSGDRKAVVFAFGANDLFYGIALDGTLAALEAVLQGARAQGWSAFVLPPPSFLDEAFIPHATAMTTAMGKLCATRSAAFFDTREAGVDWALWWEEARAGDGIHPGVGGYASLAQAFVDWAPWQAWLCEQA